jgi:histidinol-phosphatase (PHP family)
VIDYHIHTVHSTDAEGSLDAYCRRALELGLSEICFTNHCELDQKRNDNVIRLDGQVLPLSRASLAVLQEEIGQVKDKYRKSGLTVRFGLEVGFFEGVQTRLRDMTADLELDYLISGIHCLEHVCIDSSREFEGYFKRHDAKFLMEKYYKLAENLADSMMFDTFAHLDVYKKYGIGYYGAEAMKQLPVEQLNVIFKKMTQQGLALEINTAGLRRVDEFYPSGIFLRMAKEAGVENIAIGSDCHKVEDLGKGIKEGYEFARSFGFKAICGFEKRKPVFFKL